jgi:hypothetical protein
MINLQLSAVMLSLLVSANCADPMLGGNHCVIFLCRQPISCQKSSSSYGSSLFFGDPLPIRGHSQCALGSSPLVAALLGAGATAPP